MKSKRMKRKFKIGDIVEYQDSVFNDVHGVAKIIEVLPHLVDEQQYKLNNLDRVTYFRESDLKLSQRYINKAIIRKFLGVEDEV